MKKLFAIILILSFQAVIYSQNLDSLYKEYIDLKSPLRGAPRITSAGDLMKFKCAFGLVSKVRGNLNKFNALQRETLASLLTRPQTDTSIVSPLGYFRIHYNNKGTSQPAYDISKLAAAADSAYTAEVSAMAFPPPPDDSPAGGDEKYDIYIQDIAGYYGYTDPEAVAGDHSYTSYMILDNDFIGPGYKTHGIDAARITIAHEFHHAIQLGNYAYKSVNGQFPYRFEDEFFHELTSTSMEKFVFGYIYDYINYLPSFFEYPGRYFAGRTGYELSIFNIFLKEKFGYPLLKRTWEFILSSPALQAVTLALEEKSTTFRNILSEFGVWTYYTGSRARAGEYFKDASRFPKIKPVMINNFTPPEDMIMLETEPVSINPLLFVRNTGNSPDSIFALIADGNYGKGYLGNGGTTSCNYYLSSGGGEGYKQIYPGLFVKLVSPMPDIYKSRNVVNNNLVDENAVIIPEEVSDPFPQPFNYSRHSNVAVPAAKGDSEESLLYIYTLNMRLVYSGSLRVVQTDKIFVRWNGLDDAGRRLPNGVYFYVTKRNDSILKGKLVIQNE